MQFLLVAYDGTDDGAVDRRMAVRASHIELAHRLIDEGKKIYGAAIIDDNSTMIGSLMVAEFATRAELDAYLEEEPYATNNVWQTIEVHPCNVGPRFLQPAKPRA